MYGGRAGKAETEAQRKGEAGDAEGRHGQEVMAADHAAEWPAKVMAHAV